LTIRKGLRRQARCSPPLAAHSGLAGVREGRERWRDPGARQCLRSPAGRGAGSTRPRRCNQCGRPERSPANALCAPRVRCACKLERAPKASGSLFPSKTHERGSGFVRRARRSRHLVEVDGPPARPKTDRVALHPAGAGPLSPFEHRNRWWVIVRSWRRSIAAGSPSWCRSGLPPQPAGGSCRRT